MYVCITVNKPLAAIVALLLIWLPQIVFLFPLSQKVLHDQCLELRSQVISLRSQLDTSQAVQKDFVQLSQSLQVHRPNICSFGQVFTRRFFIISMLLFKAKTC